MMLSRTFCHLPAKHMILAAQIGRKKYPAIVYSDALSRIP